MTAHDPAPERPTTAGDSAPPDKVSAHIRWPAIALVLIAAALVITFAMLLRPGARSGGPAPAAPKDIASPRMLPGAPGDSSQTLAAAAAQPPSDDVARAINAAVAFVADKGPPARPFRFSGSADDRQRARACLAAAALYEAGASDDKGQRAVMQVVLNRVRHPAFTPSVCGVVFQGQERVTGCQFTFTCDGSMRFRFSDRQWEAALKRADAALDGAVDPTVGLSTHYHTDWVHPYWSTSLDKLTRVGTHLFFRWKGYWGTRTAFAIRPSGGEPSIRQLAALPGHGGGDDETTVAGPVTNAGDRPGDTSISLPARLPVDPARFGVSPTQMGGAQILYVHPQRGAFLVAVPVGMSRRRFDDIAEAICRDASFCRVQAWSDPQAVPRGLPIGPAARQSLRFEYLHDPRSMVDEQP